LLKNSKHRLRRRSFADGVFEGATQPARCVLAGRSNGAWLAVTYGAIARRRRRRRSTHLRYADRDAAIKPLNAEGKCSRRSSRSLRTPTAWHECSYPQPDGTRAEIRPWLHRRRLTFDPGRAPLVAFLHQRGH